MVALSVEQDFQMYISVSHGTKLSYGFRLGLLPQAEWIYFVIILLCFYGPHSLSLHENKTAHTGLKCHEGK